MHNLAVPLFSLLSFSLASPLISHPFLAVSSQGKQPGGKCLGIWEQWPYNDTTSVTTAGCKPVTIITIRGTCESHYNNTNNFLTGLAEDIKERNGGEEGAQVWDLPYMADWGTQAPFYESHSEGQRILQQAIGNLSTACPKTKVVLLGFSQGAQVITDAMCGGGVAERVWPYKRDYEACGPLTPPVAQNLQDMITAVAVFGDPRTRPGLSYNRGGGAQDHIILEEESGYEHQLQGVFVRREYQLCTDSAAAKIRSYCIPGDIYCAASTWDMKAEELAKMGGVHNKEHYGIYFDEAMDFIGELVISDQ